MAKKSGLGRGINALLGDIDNSPVSQPTINTQSTGYMEVSINKVSPNKEQPRRFFDNDLLEELATSIKNFGIIQPIIVNKSDDINSDNYTIIAGERRWRAARLAGLKTLPVIVHSLSDIELLQIALIENIQRQDLNPIEEAVCYKKLCDEFFFNAEDIAEKVGRAKSSVTSSIALLKLSSKVQALVIEGSLQVSHAKLLLVVEDEDMQFFLGDKISNDSLSVKEAQSLIKKYLENPSETFEKPQTPANKAIFKSFEQELLEIFETKVAIKDKNNKGKIEISYKDHEQLDSILLLLKTLKG